MAKKIIKNPVSDADVELFDGYMKKWQQLLNLMDWRVERASKRCTGAMAEIGFDDEARLAQYRVGEHFGSEEVTPRALEATALHELLHARLRDFGCAIQSGVNREGSEHAVVNTVEKLLMQAYGDKPEAAKKK